MFRIEFQHTNERRTHHWNTATISTMLPTGERADNGDQECDSDTSGEGGQNGAGPWTSLAGLSRTTAVGGRGFHRKPGGTQWHWFGIVGRLGGRGAPHARVSGARCRAAVAAKVKACAAPSYLGSGFLVDGGAIVCSGDRGIFVLDRRARRTSVHWRRRSRGFIQHTQTGSWRRGLNLAREPLTSKERGEGKGWE